MLSLRSLLKRQCNAFSVCDGKSLTICDFEWRFPSPKPFFLREFWRFGSGDAKSLRAANMQSGKCPSFLGRVLVCFDLVRVAPHLQALSGYGFAYGLNTGTRQFSTNFLVSPTEKDLCQSTDRVRFRLFSRTVGVGREYGLDWSRARFRYPLKLKRVREPHAKQYSDSGLDLISASLRYQGGLVQ